MNKLLFFFSGIAFLSQLANAQITIFQNIHEPVSGDVNSSLYYDSSGVVPKSGGTNQTWNFSAFPQTTVTFNPDVSTYTTASSEPSFSLFPGSTLAEKTNYGNTRFYRSTTNSPYQFEMMGVFDSGTIQTYTNTMVKYTWPFSYGNSFTDNWSGPIGGPGSSGSVTGTKLCTGSGTGTLVLPGGYSYPNVLQVKTTETISMVYANTFSVTMTAYSYFHGSTKFPLLTVSYAGNNGIIYANKSITVGLTDYNFDAAFAIYPNPAKNNFQVNLSNSKSEFCQVQIINIGGQLVKTCDLGSNTLIETTINIEALPPGIYVVKTSLGEKFSTRKLIIE